jgi:hypothetical protein
MPLWLEWFGLVFSLGLMAVGLFDRRHGGRLALSGAILASMSAARLVPDSLRIVAWAVAAALLVYALATTPKAIYRRLRVELTLSAVAVGLILIMELIPGLPRVIIGAFGIALVLLVAAIGVLAVARSTKPSV